MKLLGATIALLLGALVLAIGVGSAAASVPDGNGPVVTNDLIPTEQPLGDCYSMQPPPNCGSEARGGWEQNVLFGALILAIALIAWRVYANIRRVRSDT